MCGISSLWIKIRQKTKKKPKMGSNVDKNEVKTGIKGSKVKTDLKTDSTQTKRIHKKDFNEKVDNKNDKYETKMASIKANDTQKESLEKSVKEVNNNPKDVIESNKKRIELVGNHFKNEVNKSSDSSKDNKTNSNQMSEVSKSKESLNKVIESQELGLSEKIEDKNVVKTKDCKSNAIKEMNKSKDRNTIEQKIKVSENIKSQKSEEIKESSVSQTIDKVCNEDIDLKDNCDKESIHSMVCKDMKKDESNIETYKKTAIGVKNRSVNSISNIIPITSIDLKTDKCGICSILVKNKIIITGCSHIFCCHCIDEWLKYSQHCPDCRTLINRFAHNIRIGFNNQICVRSQKDYKVTNVNYNEEDFLDSYSASFLFEAFCLNHQNLKYLDFCIESVSKKISNLESIAQYRKDLPTEDLPTEDLPTEDLPTEDLPTEVGIQCLLNEQNEKLKHLREKKMRAEEGHKAISDQVNRKMLSFWKRVVNQKALINDFQ